MKIQGLIFLLGCLLAHSAWATPDATPSVGLNKFDLATQYLGTASGGDGSTAYRRVTEAMARKAIADASDIGVRYFRIALTGFAPSAHHQRGDLDLWLSDPDAYWAHIDRMMDDLDRAGIQGIFTFAWNVQQFPSMNGETVRDFIVNPKSRSIQMLERYVTQFTSRYRHSRTVLMYELTNEINLGADMDLSRRCLDAGPKPRCEATGNFTTDEMLGFLARLSAFVRLHDSTRLISAGHATPRPNAAALRAHPEWMAARPQPKLDSIEQFESGLAAINAAADVISVHLYRPPPGQSAVRGSTTGIELLDVIDRVARRTGKPLFIGEFGDDERKNGEADSFITLMLRRIVDLHVPFSALWTWETYQFKTYETRNTQATRFSIDPNTETATTRALAQVNARLGQAPLKSSKQERSAPRVVITWPLECTAISSGKEVHAIASDESGIPAVAFELDGRTLSGSVGPPYVIRLPDISLAPGAHILAARATDPHGNAATYEVRVLTGDVAATSCQVR